MNTQITSPQIASHAENSETISIKLKVRKRILQPDIRAMEKAQKYIFQNLSKPMPSIVSLSKEACMSPSKFQRLFYEIYEQSIYQYQLKARIDLAKQLLLSNEYTVTQVAYRVGFQYHQSFIKAFLKHTGHSPSTFQKIYGE